MTQAQAERIIGTLQRDHKLFKLVGYQCQPDGALFVTFERINISLVTIAGWIDMAGACSQRVGVEGQGDNEVMYASIKL